MSNHNSREHSPLLEANIPSSFVIAKDELSALNPNNLSPEQRDSVAKALQALQESIRAFRELQHEATTDPLTGLFNRKGLDLVMESKMSDLRRHKSGLCVVSVDLDGFKLVNDSFGHQGGDSLLIEVADRIKQSRGGDISFRMGGDEFLVIAPEVKDAKAAYAVGNRILHVVTEPFKYTEKGYDTYLEFGASVGSLACDDLVGVELYDLIGASDELLLEVKAKGKNNVFAALYDPKERVGYRDYIMGPTLKL